jgi:hypothetical protein
MAVHGLKADTRTVTPSRTVPHPHPGLTDILDDHARHSFSILKELARMQECEAAPNQHAKADYK